MDATDGQSGGQLSFYSLQLSQTCQSLTFTKAQTNKQTNKHIPGIEVCSCLNIIISINISGTSSNDTRSRTDKNQRRARAEGEEGFSSWRISDM